jgi:hypothetical protein
MSTNANATRMSVRIFKSRQNIDRDASQPTVLSNEEAGDALDRESFASNSHQIKEIKKLMTDEDIRDAALICRRMKMDFQNAKAPCHQQL